MFTHHMSCSRQSLLNKKETLGTNKFSREFLLSGKMKEYRFYDLSFSLVQGINMEHDVNKTVMSERCVYFVYLFIFRGEGWKAEDM